MLHCFNYKDTDMTFVNQVFIATVVFVIYELFVDQVCGLTGEFCGLTDKDLLLNFFQWAVKTV